MSASVKIREQRVRRALAEIGMSLRKSPSPDRRDNGSGYMIVDDRNHVSGGRPNLRFEADLKQVEWFAFEHGANRVRRAKRRAHPGNPERTTVSYYP